MVTKISKKKRKTSEKILSRLRVRRRQNIESGTCTKCNKRKVDKPRSKTLCRKCRLWVNAYMQKRSNSLRRKAGKPQRNKKKTVRSKSVTKKKVSTVSK